MEKVAAINSLINSFVWGPYMLVLLVGTGIFISIATGFFQIRRIPLWFSKTFGALRSKKVASTNITPFQAVSAALASTVGTGNIAGVATAIVAGGPGAVFWMWVSAFFGMMTKYSEVLLAVYFREKDENGVHFGGPMYYIEKGMKVKWLAVAFALFGTFASFGIGNMTQSNSIASALQGFSIPPIATGVVFALLSGLVIIGGIKRIATVTEKLVPFMAVLYFCGAVLLLILNANAIPEAFSVIFSSAFNVKSIGGGVMGYGIAQAMRYGFARGVFSNEAGLGSAPIAHAASDSNNPVEQGMWGIFEVFVDTIIICTLTALVVLTSGLYISGDLSGAALTVSAFQHGFGNLGSVFLSVSLICFAFSTIIGWSYYGERCLAYLSKNNKLITQIYRVLFIASIIIGATLELTLVWNIADTLNGLMAIPNLIALLFLSGTIFTLTKKYLKDPSSIEM